MIGVFAKMFGPSDRVAEVTPLEGRDGYEVKSVGPNLEAKLVADDEPPAAFTEKLATEGGTVYMSPLVEALREWVQKRKPGAK